MIAVAVTGTVAIVGIGVLSLIIVAVSVALFYRSRNGSETSTPNNLDADATADARREDGVSATARATAADSDVDPQEVFEDRIGESTLERLDPVVPEAVAETREHARNLVSPEEVERIERDLRRAIEGELATGELALCVTSVYGDRFEIVNLPARYREVDLPLSSEPIHVRDVEDVLAERLEDDGTSVREVALVVEAVCDHRAETERYVERRSQGFAEQRAAAEDNLESTRELLNRLDNGLADRLAEIVVEGRGAGVEGVLEVERRIDRATAAFHNCAFDDAEREISDARETSDELLLTVDFLNGLDGTIEHGGGNVTIPDAVPSGVIDELAPLLEQTYGVAAEVTNDAIAFENGPVLSVDASGAGQRSHDRSNANGSKTASVSGSDEGRASGSRGSGISLGTVADEALFVLRELESLADEGAPLVEYQTGNLPDSIARADLLVELVDFCRRQTDVVKTVELQANAPPGFLTIEFTDRADARAGVEALRERFLDRYLD